MKAVFLVIAGTFYGRKLSEELCRAGAVVYATVATEYGRELMEASAGGDLQNLTILQGRVDSGRMRELLARLRPDAVINAAHPYAVEAGRMGREACKAANIKYFRLLRESQPAESVTCATDAEGAVYAADAEGAVYAAGTEGAVYVADMEEAVKFLKTVSGNIFSACGGKGISRLTAIDGYRERVFIRALPTQEFLNECKALGFASKNIICMQGPFSKELNVAMLRSTGAKWLLTKDSGSAGGFSEKLDAAFFLGVAPVIIGRPPQDEGLYYDELLEMLSRDYGLCYSNSNGAKFESNPIKTKSIKNPEYPYFPMFVSLAGKQAKVFGAGNVANRRINVLLRFGCRVSVVAAEQKSELNSAVSVNIRKYREGDCEGADLVVAATDDRDVNRQIAEECARLGIPASICDDKSLCTFFFPAVAVQGEVVVGVTSSGTDHKKTKKIAQNIRAQIEEGNR